MFFNFVKVISVDSKYLMCTEEMISFLLFSVI